MAATGRADVGPAHQRSARVLVVGLGNPLMADDGIGPAVVGRMIRRGLPAALRAATIEGDLLSLASVWRGEREVWLVDAVTGSGPPGTLHDLGHREVLDVPGGGFTAHHPNVGDCLRWLMHAWPDLGSVRYRLFGVEVEVVRPGDRLSAVVETAVERLVDRLLEAADEGVVRRASNTFAR